MLASPPTSIAAEGTLATFKQQRNAWQRCAEYMGITTNAHVLWYTLSVFEYVIGHKWGAIPDAEKVSAPALPQRSTAQHRAANANANANANEAQRIAPLSCVALDRRCCHAVMRSCSCVGCEMLARTSRASKLTLTLTPSIQAAIRQFLFQYATQKVSPVPYVQSKVVKVYADLGKMDW